MFKISPQDIKERERIERELDKNFLVEAGAGSGKTASLIKRMVSLIITKGCCPGEIAAITFTRKAAAELRERFQTGLEEASCKTKDPLVQERLARALMDLEQCFLGTIHSFCGRLLRERPVEAGLDTYFQEMDESQNLFLVERAWDSYLVEVKLHHPVLLNNLNEIGVSLEDLKAAYLNLVNYPELKMVCAAVDKPDLRPALQKLMELSRRAKGDFPAVPVENRYDALQEKIQKSLRCEQYYDLNRDIHRVRILNAFGRNNHRVIQKLWNSKESAKYYAEEFNQLAEQVISPALKAWREYCHDHIMQVMLPGLDYFQKIKDGNSLLNFQDLLMKAAEMLREYPEVRDYFQGKYRYLLVDEFQDTDPIQSEVMLYLTGIDVKEKDWQKLTSRPGSLFVVGDPKQSIYRFRRADIDTYNLVKKIIREGGGEVLTLTTNFRSLKAPGEFCNSVFQELLAQKENPYQALYYPVNTVRENEEGTGFGVRVLEVEESCKKKADIVERDAENIARFIKNALEGGLKLSRTPQERESGLGPETRPGDFMIILRYKEMMDIYARSLESLNIPVNIAGGSSLPGNREVCELLILLRAVADPDHQVFLVAALRGLFVGLSDDDLYRFKKGGGKYHIFSRVPGELSPELAGLFQETFRRLVEFWCWSREFPPSVVLEKIIHSLGLIPYTLSESLGKSRCSYFLQLVEHQKKAEASGIKSFYEMVENLEVLISTGLEEELEIDVQGEPGVRLMNLHKAKGLEAPVVFLANPYKYIMPSADMHVCRRGNRPVGYFTLSEARQGLPWRGEVIAQPLDWPRYEQEELKYLQAEEIRLLYVAATRAKNLLVISRSRKDAGMSKNPWKLLLEKIPEGSEVSMEEVFPQEEIPLGVEVVPREGAQVLERFGLWKMPLSEPGYAQLSPSDLKPLDGLPGVKRVTGGGTLWGSMIHRVMEALVKGNLDLEAIVVSALRENRQPESRKEEVFKEIEKFQRSELWERICRSRRKFTEVPFVLKVEENHNIFQFLGREDRIPVILSGTVDLVFQEAEGWVIVDYKTDRVEDRKGLDGLVNFYGEQVRLYALVWKELTGEKVKGGEIYFVHMKESRGISPTP